MRILLLTLIVLINPRLYAQNTEVVTFDRLEKLIEEPSGKLRIYNFWATYCAPCIAEMPLFEQANGHESVEVIFVSLDFVENLESKVNPFIKRKKIRSTTILLDDIDYNSWINKVSPEWTGAIPATLFVKEGSRVFHEGEISEEQLNRYIKNLNARI